MTVYDRHIVAFDGCDAEVAERLLDSEPFKKSQDYDRLGERISWEFGPSRALKFAHDQKARGKVRTPAVVGATL